MRNAKCGMGTGAFRRFPGRALHIFPYVAPAGPDSPRIPMTTPSRMPVAYVPHGGGPWPFVKLGWEDVPGYREEYDSLFAYLQSVSKLPKTPPKALLIVSAHWEENVPTVQANPRPGMLYDYYGFPDEAYRLTWPAPGSPELAARVRELLEGAGFVTAAHPQRGYDHGAFVPLKVTYPDADVPAIQLSLIAGLDPETHLQLGRALAPLRDEGVFIVGTGMSFHNMRAFFSRGSGSPGEAFDAWLRQAATLPPAERDAALARWSGAPGAREAHPREEHLVPLHVIAGAAGDEPLRTAWTGSFLGARISAFEAG